MPGQHRGTAQWGLHVGPAAGASAFAIRGPPVSPGQAVGGGHACHLLAGGTAHPRLDAGDETPVLLGGLTWGGSRRPGPGVGAQLGPPQGEGLLKLAWGRGFPYHLRSYRAGLAPAPTYRHLPPMEVILRPARAFATPCLWPQDTARSLLFCLQTLRCVELIAPSGRGETSSLEVTHRVSPRPGTRTRGSEWPGACGGGTSELMANGKEGPCPGTSQIMGTTWGGLGSQAGVQKFPWNTPSWFLQTRGWPAEGGSVGRGAQPGQEAGRWAHGCGRDAALHASHLLSARQDPGGWGEGPIHG